MKKGIYALLGVLISTNLIAGTTLKEEVRVLEKVGNAIVLAKKAKADISHVIDENGGVIKETLKLQSNLNKNIQGNRNDN